MAQQTLDRRLHARLTVGLLLGCVPLGCGGRTPSERGADNAPSGGRDVLIAEQPGSGAISPSVESVDAPMAVISAPSPPAPAPEQVPVQLTGDMFTIVSNQGAVEGSLFLVTSPLGTTLELVEASGRICVRGELAVVPDGDYPNYWGGEVGLVLVSNAEEEAPPAEALATPGFAFSLEGALPIDLRFRVGAAGEIPLYSQYCQPVPVTTGARIEMPLTALTYECWVSGGNAFPRASGATLISWQIPANEYATGAFDFCIDDIQTL